ncbi:MAG: hypothetical protein KJ569_03225, partial [Candidatus Omnitrophica bacterium]|nr:hypothetical protein [Candidatus Omnitrophota bacterium]
GERTWKFALSLAPQFPPLPIILSSLLAFIFGPSPRIFEAVIEVKGAREAYEFFDEITQSFSYKFFPFSRFRRMIKKYKRLALAEMEDPSFEKNGDSDHFSEEIVSSSLIYVSEQILKKYAMISSPVIFNRQFFIDREKLGTDTILSLGVVASPAERKVSVPVYLYAASSGAMKQQDCLWFAKDYLNEEGIDLEETAFYKADEQGQLELVKGKKDALYVAVDPTLAVNRFLAPFGSRINDCRLLCLNKRLYKEIFGMSTPHNRQGVSAIPLEDTIKETGISAGYLPSIVHEVTHGESSLLRRFLEFLLIGSVITILMVIFIGGEFCSTPPNFILRLFLVMYISGLIYLTCEEVRAVVRDKNEVVGNRGETLNTILADVKRNKEYLTYFLSWVVFSIYQIILPNVIPTLLSGKWIRKASIYLDVVTMDKLVGKSIYSIFRLLWYYIKKKKELKKQVPLAKKNLANRLAKEILDRLERENPIVISCLNEKVASWDEKLGDRQFTNLIIEKFTGVYEETKDPLEAMRVVLALSLGSFWLLEEITSDLGEEKAKAALKRQIDKIFLSKGVQESSYKLLDCYWELITSSLNFPFQPAVSAVAFASSPIKNKDYPISQEFMNKLNILEIKGVKIATLVPATGEIAIDYPYMENGDSDYFSEEIVSSPVVTVFENTLQQNKIHSADSFDAGLREILLHFKSDELSPTVLPETYKEFKQKREGQQCQLFPKPISSPILLAHKNVESRIPSVITYARISIIETLLTSLCIAQQAPPALEVTTVADSKPPVVSIDTAAISQIPFEINLPSFSPVIFNRQFFIDKCSTFIHVFKQLILPRKKYLKKTFYLHCSRLALFDLVVEYGLFLSWDRPTLRPYMSTDKLGRGLPSDIYLILDIPRKQISVDYGDYYVKKGQEAHLPQKLQQKLCKIGQEHKDGYIRWKANILLEQNASGKLTWVSLNMIDIEETLKVNNGRLKKEDLRHLEQQLKNINSAASSVRVASAVAGHSVRDSGDRTLNSRIVSSPLEKGVCPLLSSPEHFDRLPGKGEFIIPVSSAVRNRLQKSRGVFLVLGLWQESNGSGSIGKGNIKVGEEILSSDEIETNPQTRRETDCCLELIAAYFYLKLMQIYGNYASVPNGAIDCFAFLVVYLKSLSFFDSENRDSGAGIYVTFYFLVAFRGVYLDRNYGIRIAFKDFIKESNFSHGLQDRVKIFRLRNWHTCSDGAGMFFSRLYFQFAGIISNKGFIIRNDNILSGIPFYQFFKVFPNPTIIIQTYLTYLFHFYLQII